MGSDRAYRLWIQDRSLRSHHLVRILAGLRLRLSHTRPRILPLAASSTSLEDRLRRMEEAYRRMEEANKKIQGQDHSLLKKYDDLNHRVGPGTVGNPGRSTSTITRPASRVGAVEYQEPPDRDASQGLGALKAWGGEPRLVRGFDTSTGGLEARGPLVVPGGLPPTPSAPGGRPPGGTGGSQPPIGGRHRRPGCRGSRVPARDRGAGRGEGPRRAAKVEFAEGLEVSSPDEEFKLTFHNLTQAEYRGFPADRKAYSSRSSSFLANGGISPAGRRGTSSTTPSSTAATARSISSMRSSATGSTTVSGSVPGA